MAATAAAAVFSGASQARAPAPRLLKPPRLKAGALVGLIAPGGVVDDSIIQKCVTNLEGQGFRVKPGANLRAAHGGYAGTVAQRLEDLHAMFFDREVQAIWAARGGSGTFSLLPGIDYALVRRHPKILIGYSDVTALHLAMRRHAGLVTFHGPVAWSTFAEFTMAQLRAVLMEPERGSVLPMAEENLAKGDTARRFAPRVFRAGVAEGRLIGGNLSLLAALTGTAFAIEPQGTLVFIEEEREAPYRIDRMLTQLRLSGTLTKARGVIFGVFDRCEPTDDDPSLTLAETLEEQMSALRIPSAYGYSFGHITPQITLPVGIRARFDTEARTITLLETAVV